MNPNTQLPPTQPPQPGPIPTPSPAPAPAPIPAPVAAPIDPTFVASAASLVTGANPVAPAPAFAAPTPGAVPPPTGASPNYQEIMRQILSELNKRKGILLARVLLNLAPFLLAIVLFYVASQFGDSESGKLELGSPQSTLMLIALGLIVLVTPLWTFVTGAIFKTERSIWIDAFFDDVSLTSKQSWKIATELFWPSIFLRLSIFFRYYALPLLGAILLIVGGIYFSLSQPDNPASPFIGGGSILVSIIGLSVYAYITGIRLRYVWFIFLDAYGTPEYSHKYIFDHMKELNRRVKEGDLSKIIVTTLGLDVTGAVAKTAIDVASDGLSMLGSGGRAAGSILSLVGNTMVQVSKDYAKQVSYYMFYRLARQAIFGVDDKGSKSLYAGRDTTTL